MELNNQPYIVDIITTLIGTKKHHIAIIKIENKYTYTILEKEKFKYVNLYFSTIEQCRKAIKNIK